MTTLEDIGRRLFGNLLNREIEALMSEGYERPLGAAIVLAASKRLHVRAATELAAQDGHLILAWFLRRYYHRIAPDWREDEQEEET